MTQLRFAFCIALFVLLTSCTPAQIAHWKSLGPDPVTAETMTPTQRAVIRHLEQQRRDYLAAVARHQNSLRTDCGAAMRSVWPRHLWSWADSIMHRESRHQHNAANPRSSARGCWQLLSSLHADKYAAVGCHVSQWSDALCNNKAAYRLYQIAGTSPWAIR
jgi:hypothetical protein